MHDSLLALNLELSISFVSVCVDSTAVDEAQGGTTKEKVVATVGAEMEWEEF